MVGLSVGVGLSTAADTLFSQVCVYIVYDYSSLEEMYIHVVHIHTCTHNTICAWKNVWFDYDTSCILGIFSNLKYVHMHT